MHMVDRAALMPVEEYLALTRKPYCEYRDGVLREKAWPTYEHGMMEGRIPTLINQARLGLEALPELTLKVSERIYLIPDVAVVRVSEIEKPYPTKPVFLCIEILSPEDHFSDTLAKCEEYHAWGVPFCWIVDPDDKRCWEYHAGDRLDQISANGHLTAEKLSLRVWELVAGRRFVPG
jgi:Uma2 family endonuclease